MSLWWFRYSVAPTSVVTRTFYAAVPTTLAPRGVPDVRAVVCDPVEDTNPCLEFSRQPSVTCTTSGLNLGAATYAQATVIFDAGRVLVPCGTVSETIQGTVTLGTSGFHYRHAFILGL